VDCKTEERTAILFNISKTRCSLSYFFYEQSLQGLDVASL
jgi:hypothetical protein